MAAVILLWILSLVLMLYNLGAWIIFKTDQEYAYGSRKNAKWFCIFLAVFLVTTFVITA